MNKTKFARYWRTALPDELIECPYQPGNLKILKRACLMRRQASENFSLLREVRNEFFVFVVKQGLSVCKDCPAGN